MTNIFDTTEYRQELAAQRTFMGRVYGWMTIGLLVTALLALAVSSNLRLAASIFGGVSPIVFILVQIGIAMAFTFLLEKIPVSVAAGLFILYSAVTGVVFSILLLIYTAESVAATFFITAGTFGAMSVYGYVTKKDLSSLGTFLMMGLIGLTIAIIVNWFMQSEMMGYIISCVGVVVFTLLTAYDTQKIKQMYAVAEFGSATSQKLALLGAFKLYLDFINLFIFLLRLLGSRRN